MQPFGLQANIQIPALVLMPFLLLCSGCTDKRTPFEAYVECDAEIAGADSLQNTISCLTEGQLELLRARVRQDSAWFSQYQASRSQIMRLHEEQLLDRDDESILMVVGQTQSGRPVAITAQMIRDHGRWKVDYEESIPKGATTVDGAPAPVELKPASGSPWYPGELVGFAYQRPDGHCQLTVTHVFEYPLFRLTTACEKLATPGSYSSQDLARAAGRNPVTFYDLRHVGFGRLEGGRLTVTSNEGGNISGTFRFELANASEQLTVHGSYSGLPLKL